MAECSFLVRYVVTVSSFCCSGLALLPLRLRFCWSRSWAKAYKKNEDGIAERIQREVNMQHINAQSEAEKAQKAMEERIAELEKALEREQEWRPVSAVQVWPCCLCV